MEHVFLKTGMMAVWRRAGEGGGQGGSLAFDAKAARPDQTPDSGGFLNFAHMTGPQGDVNI